MRNKNKYDIGRLGQLDGQGHHGERKFIVLAVLLFFNLILVSTNVVLKNRKTLFEQVLGTLVAPFQIGFQETVDFVSYQARHYVFLKRTFEKYRDLKHRYTQLRYENYLLKKQVADQDFLKRLKLQGGDYIKADLVSVDPNFPLTSVMINKGTQDGIRNNMVVLNPEMELVGRVVEPVTLFSARVRLITSSIGGTGAYIDNPDPTAGKLEGLITGNNDERCRFAYLLENAPVKVGDRVVTSGTDLIYPPYIPIGNVVGVETEGLTLDVAVEPFFVKRSIKQLIIVPGNQLMLIESNGSGEAGEGAKGKNETGK